MYTALTVRSVAVWLRFRSIHEDLLRTRRIIGLMYFDSKGTVWRSIAEPKQMRAGGNRLMTYSNPEMYIEKGMLKAYQKNIVSIKTMV